MPEPRFFGDNYSYIDDLLSTRKHNLRCWSIIFSKLLMVKLNKVDLRKNDFKKALVSCSHQLMKI
jgi:hypothetical protein